MYLDNARNKMKDAIAKGVDLNQQWKDYRQSIVAKVVFASGNMGGEVVHLRV